MPIFKSINPFSQQEIEEFSTHSSAEIEFIIESASISQKHWRTTSYDHRAQILTKTANLLLARKNQLALTITQEMGKPISQSISEIEKCAWLCEYYASVGSDFLHDQTIETDATHSFVRYAPLGTILGIMPWNYPFWQVFRFAVPTLFAGNAALLKHAPNVTRCALQIEQIFLEAGIPEGLYSTVICEVDQVETILADKRIHGVSLTGSTKAGQSVAQLAGKYLKPSLLELGGSNAFIIAEDASLNKAIETAWMARMQNTGQSCIAAKRFILHDSMADEFIDKMLAKIKENPIGDPTEKSTFFGSLARPDLAENIENQVNRSVQKGAQLITGGQRDGAKFEPTLLDHVETNFAAFQEETFGPVATISRVNNIRDAVIVANTTEYGLGATIFTENPEQHYKWINELKDGAVFFNELVKSDPRLPFGGTGISGYGRELAQQGLQSFTNVKTVYIK